MRILERIHKMTAFITLDTESFFETECMQNAEFDIDRACTEGLDAFLDFLDGKNIKSTLFVTEQMLDLCGERLKKAAENGHEIAVHSLKHKPINTYEEYSLVLSVMKEKILKITGVEPVGYRAPCFSVTKEGIQALKDNGFLYDSSVLEVNNTYGSNRVSLASFNKINDSVFEKDGFFEVKPAVADTVFGKIPVSGGAYVRLFPWCFIGRVLKKHIKNADSFLFYVHPFELTGKKLTSGFRLNITDWLFINRGRKKYFEKFAETIDFLEKSGYNFYTVKNYIKNMGEVENNG